MKVEKRLDVMLIEYLYFHQSQQPKKREHWQ